MGQSHTLTVIINGAQVDGWSGYHVDSSMITPADAFELRRPFSAQAWNLFRRDSDVTIQIDGTTILRGIINTRQHNVRAGTMELGGRDRGGRMVDESAPAIDYSGMTILAAAKLLVGPWFDEVIVDDARNRLLRRGKGKRVNAGTEPVVDIKLRVPRRGIVHPGESRWQVLHEICSRAGLVAYSTADGRKLFIGKPNQTQPPQYLFAHTAPGSTSGIKATVRDMTITEDDGDRFSLIMCGGTGGQSSTNYGTNVTDNRGVVFDNPANRIDGTGRDFIHPKRMYMPERDFESYGDAQRVAANEQARRDFKRHGVSIEMEKHGQFLDAGAMTLFSPNTVGRVVNEEWDPTLDDNYLIVSCSYSSTHDQGETTTMHMVPTGTEIIL